MPNSSSKESDRRYGKRKSSDEEHYSKSIASYSDFRSSGKDKKNSTEVIKHPIKTYGEWSEFLSSAGKIYYYNSKTEKTQWDKPDEWDWLQSQEEKNYKNDKGYYSRDYNKGNRSYRSKYDDSDQIDSKSQRYNENHKSYAREYSNASSNLGSSSFRPPNSYGNSFVNNMNEPSHRGYGNACNSGIQSSGVAGGEYYENNSNMSSSSSNDYYNYRNYGQSSKNEQDKYWNETRSSKSRNQKMDDLSYKMSPARYQSNLNYNNYEDSINHGSKQFIYQKHTHPSRYDNFNEKNSTNEQYPSSSMYNSTNSNHYYNSNSNNIIPNDIEMRETSSRQKYLNKIQADDLNDNYQQPGYDLNLSRNSSRSKSSHSNVSCSESSNSSVTSSSEDSIKNSKKHKKSKKKSRKRSKKHSESKNSKLKTNSPNKSSQTNNQIKNSDENSNSNSNNNPNNPAIAAFNTNETDHKISNEQIMQQTNDQLTDQKVNNTLRPQKSQEETKSISSKTNNDTDLTDKKDSSVLEAEEIATAKQVEAIVPNTNSQSNGSASNHNQYTSNHNSIFMPVLLSTSEDISKYYKPELLTRLNGFDFNDRLNLINSQVLMKHLHCTSLSAELKNYRSLVRFKEIKKTLQEQRLQFLQNQMKEIEELLN